MTDDSRFDDLYERVNELTLEVTNLKVGVSVIPTTQVAISQLLTLTTGLASDSRQIKADIREINSRLRALEANARNTDASINEILRLLRERGN
ncbi:MAG: hypothetical protein KME64_03900 [Scytonematopsis contorta HA4267-MV1]|jgi:hypothetical protein|nr:hypothetical protein [Scytonematopsis contorta HA4267-MV1]